jgi:hypothetical protein
MKIDYTKAQVLCTATEFSLLTESKPAALAGMDAATLGKKVSQARRFSDKWRQQSRNQGSSKDGSAARSLEKHELFKETLARFEARLAKVSAVTPVKKTDAVRTVAKKAATKKASGKVAKKAVKKSTKIPVLAKRSRKAPSPMGLASQARQKSIGTDLRISASGQNSRIRGHVGASGRRNQAALSSRKRS